MLFEGKDLLGEGVGVAEVVGSEQFALDDGEGTWLSQEACTGRWTIRAF